jgi:hypothetical protein
MNKITSETLRNKSVDLKKNSVHVPLHKKPESDYDFGQYLAGLIDGDGYFSNTPQLVIVFNELDAYLAYWIKRKIGYGNVYKVKNKKAVIFVIGNREGLVKVLNLINGKLRTQKKLDQILKNIISHPLFSNVKKEDLPLFFSIQTDDDLNNY